MTLVPWQWLKVPCDLLEAVINRVSPIQGFREEAFRRSASFNALEVFEEEHELFPGEQDGLDELMSQRPKFPLESLLKAYIQARTPEVEEQALADLDREYPGWDVPGGPAVESPEVYGPTPYEPLHPKTARALATLKDTVWCVYCKGFVVDCDPDCITWQQVYADCDHTSCPSGYCSLGITDENIGTVLSSAAVSAGSAASPTSVGDNCPEGGSVPPAGSPSGPPDPLDTNASASSAVSSEGPVADSAIPPAPATGQPDLVDVIAEVLAEHWFHWDSSGFQFPQGSCHCGEKLWSVGKWDAHVAPLIASRIEQAQKRSVAG